MDSLSVLPGNTSSPAATSSPAPLAPLADVHVLSLGGIGPGPFAAMLLADMGAHVTRVVRPAPAGQPRPRDIVAHDILYRGQQVLELNLKDPDDVARLRERIPDTDIVLEGFRPGVAERLGLGPAELEQLNPALVYGRMTGWGQDGPRAQSAGHDINYLAISGALEPIAGAGGEPVPPLNFLGDFGGGALYLVSGVLAGLLRARAGGIGCVVDAAIVDGAAHMTAMLHSMLAAGEWAGPRRGNVLDGGAPFYTTYRTSDGRYMAVGALEPQFYAALLDGLGLREKLAHLEQHNRAHWPTLHAAFAAAFAARPQAEWTQVFAGTDACVTPVVSPSEVLDEPHLAARGTYLPRPDAPGHVQPAPAPRFGPLS